MRFNHTFKKRNSPPLLKTFHTRCRFAPHSPPFRPLQGITPIKKNSSPLNSLRQNIHLPATNPPSLSPSRPTPGSTSKPP